MNKPIQALLRTQQLSQGSVAIKTFLGATVRLRFTGREQTGAEACGPVGVLVCAHGDPLLTFASGCCPGIALATATPACHPFIDVVLSCYLAPLVFQLSGEQDPQ